MCGKLSLPETYIHITLLMVRHSVMKEHLSGQKVGVETVVAAFTDHLAIFLRMKMESLLLQRGWGLWKINTKLLKDTTKRSLLQQEWTRWRLQEGKYLDMVTWGRNMSNGKSVSFSTKNGLGVLEKIRKTRIFIPFVYTRFWSNVNALGRKDPH